MTGINSPQAHQARKVIYDLAGLFEFALQPLHGLRMLVGECTT